LVNVDLDVGFGSGSQFVDMLRSVEILPAVMTDTELEGPDAADQKPRLFLSTEGEPMRVGSISVFLGNDVAMVLSVYGTLVATHRCAGLPIPVAFMRSASEPRKAFESTSGFETNTHPGKVAELRSDSNFVIQGNSAARVDGPLLKVLDPVLF
jgi:hypothetical protein